MVCRLINYRQRNNKENEKLLMLYSLVTMRIDWVTHFSIFQIKNIIKVVKKNLSRRLQQPKLDETNYENLTIYSCFPDGWMDVHIF